MGDTACSAPSSFRGQRSTVQRRLRLCQCLARTIVGPNAAPGRRHAPPVDFGFRRKEELNHVLRDRMKIWSQKVQISFRHDTGCAVASGYIHARNCDKLLIYCEQLVLLFLARFLPDFYAACCFDIAQMNRYRRHKTHRRSRIRTAVLRGASIYDFHTKG